MTADPRLIQMMWEALGSTQVGICLCDEQDNVRYCNEPFRAALFPDLPNRRIHFVDAVTAAIASGTSVKLESMSLDVFAARIRERRRTGSDRFSFAMDLMDGTWWWVNDYRLPTGWTLAIASEISGLKREELRLREEHASALKASQTDSLTGLANRRRGMAKAEKALTDFKTNCLPLTVALLDIDHFKQINDIHGHEAGDDVLVHFARFLTEQVGARDEVSRIGGEEFLIVMPETPGARAMLRLRRLLLSLTPVPRTDLRQTLQFSFSAGLASAHPSETLKMVLSRADAALYAAKSKGRRRVEMSDGSDVNAA